MHITLETDYAIRIVDFMAKNDGRFDAKAISEKTYEDSSKTGKCRYSKLVQRH